MKQIKVDFVDFYDGHDKENNYIMRVLREKYDPVISQDADYLFCGPYISPGNHTRHFLEYKGIRIFMTDEAIVPDFNLYDYAIGFDKLEYGDRYCRYPIFVARDTEVEEAKMTRSFSMEDLKAKTEFCNFVVSNGNADEYRAKLFEALDAYKKVVSGGKYKNNIGGPVKDKKEFQRKCKFSIACENSKYTGYTTEKIIDAYAAATIPIYWGDPEITSEFDERSFINCNKFASIEDVVKEVIRIDQDDESFLQMMHSPVFRDGVVEQLRSNLRTFLFNIFDQPYEEAFRRNRSNAGTTYESEHRRMQKLFGVTNHKLINKSLSFCRKI
jgi:hypothetical protein